MARDSVVHSTRLETSKDDLIARAAKAAESWSSSAGTGGPAALRRMLDRYYRHVAPEDLVGRDPVDVLGAMMSNRDLALQRPQGLAKVRVFTPTIEDDGWSSGHTVVEIVTDDMPFLVDSVTSSLTQDGRAIHVVVHPVMYARRTITGELTELVEVEPGQQSPEGATVESWMHLEVDRETDQKDVDEIATLLRRVLSDVREAVEDWTKLRGTALRIADELTGTPPVGVAPADVAEACELLRWLAEDNFTFLGYREYELEAVEGGDHLLARPGSGLGILRSDPMVSAVRPLPPQVLAKAREPVLLMLTKANARSTVHRPAHLDYVGLKTFDDLGRVTGERRFLGLFTAGAYTQSVLRIPVLRHKVTSVLDMAGLPASSHSGKDLLTILETYPRDELFQVPVAELLPTALAVLHLQERRQTRLFVRLDDYGRFMSCLVYLPRDRYTTEVRLEMARILQEAYHGTEVDYTARVSESVLARLHFVVRLQADQPVPVVDRDDLERRLADATRSWADDFADALVEQCGEESGAHMLKLYADAFPEAYKEDFPARSAVADLRQLEQLEHGGMAVNLYRPIGVTGDERRFKIFRSGDPMSLTRVLPVLQRLGVEVVDERPYHVTRSDGQPLWVYDFGLRYPAGAANRSGTEPDSAAHQQDAGTLKDRFEAAFIAAWTGAAESDGFNRLVLGAGLTWRQAAMLRAYAKYLRQAGSMFSQGYVEDCLAGHPDITRLLVELFETRFDPAFVGDRQAQQATVVKAVATALNEVATLDQDRILRSFRELVLATLRTSCYQTRGDGHPRDYVAFKLDPQRIRDLPAPKPKYEIWVYGPTVEGVHLRFGPVARGGLRWSDRSEDFRTEILGLVKAQAVKNAVIVPVGAKGGYVVKASTADRSSREAVLAEGTDRYRTFIAGLLDVTDNLVDGHVVPPERVVRHDGDDPYLVVAADKGTATFSDIANSIAQERGFWLGDAFASGGSAGYDHKAMGITARGAWVSVMRHFREMGVDTQNQDFTVVGIGDMSGDVFGNGMLLSEHIKLVAAFDHRHIFLDPDPDPAASFKERQRLFGLPRSSWADYDRSLISPGGGVYERLTKSVPLTPEVRRVLGLPERAGADAEDATTPPELLRAILLAPVDLLWNGGIGTYVKAATESKADVGDKANDAIRVNGGDLRVKVVGEGGNLGLTQRGRIEAARAGVRLNTDAIDNSAGVDTSDHEVNIKILVDQVVRSGDLTRKQRNEFLRGMTEAVGDHVLRDNYEQNILLGNARAQTHAMLPVHQRLIRELVRSGELDRELEALPGDKEIDARFAAGTGLTSPEFSVLVAYSKIMLKGALLETGLPDEPWFRQVLAGYFPPALTKRFGNRLDGHRLRREIVTTVLVNEIVNRGGITFVFRAREETGATPAEIARASMVARAVFRLPDYWPRVEALDNRVPTTAQSALLLECRRLLDRATRWVLQSRRSLVDIGAEVEYFAAVPDLVPQIPDMLRGVERERLSRRTAEFVELGAPADLAAETAAMLDAFSLLDVVEIARHVDEEPLTVGQLYFALSEEFDVDQLLGRITQLPRDDRWSALARMSLRYDLYASLAGLTRNVISAAIEEGVGAEDADQRIAVWSEHNAEGLARARGTLADIGRLDSFNLATLSVAMRTIRTLISTHRG